VLLLPDESHRRREVGRADQDAVDPLDGRDLLDVLDRCRRLDLHEERDRRRGIREVAIDAIPPRGASERAADTPDPVRGIPHGAHHGLSLLGRVDHGDEQVLHAEVEVLLDGDRVAERRAHERGHRVGGDRLQLREDRLEAVRRVLGIDEYDVESAARGDLGVHRARRAHPHAELRAIGCRDPRGERRRKCHSNRHVTAPNSR
jgi:hypothetical protein